MDIESIKETIGALGIAIGVLKQAKDLLPDSTKKEEITEALKKAERELSLAESQVAHGLGYELCKNHFPPEIMLSIDEINWKCPKCDNERNIGPTGTIINFEDSKNRRLFHD